MPTCTEAKISHNDLFLSLSLCLSLSFAFADEYKININIRSERISQLHSIDHFILSTINVGAFQCLATIG